MGDTTLLLRTLKRAGMMYPFRPTKTTFQELFGGGNSSVIEDREVLRGLIAYYSATELPLEATRLAIRRIWFEYYDALSETIDPALIPSMTLDVFGLLREGRTAPGEAPSERALPSLGLLGTPFDPGVLRGSMKFERALAMVLDSSVLVREALKYLLSAATVLLKRLDDPGTKEQSTSAS